MRFYQEALLGCHLPGGAPHATARPRRRCEVRFWIYREAVTADIFTSAGSTNKFPEPAPPQIEPVGESRAESQKSFQRISLDNLRPARKFQIEVGQIC